MGVNLFRTIKEGDTMLDLIKNVLLNLNFYLEHFDFFNKIGYTKEEGAKIFTLLPEGGDLNDNN